jgi:hypothetical protein
MMCAEWLVEALFIRVHLWLNCRFLLTPSLQPASIGHLQGNALKVAVFIGLQP